MTQKQKIENGKFFQMLLKVLNEGGHYVYPDIMKTFTKVNGKLQGDREGIEVLKDMTPVSFHENLIIK